MDEDRIAWTFVGWHAYSSTAIQGKPAIEIWIEAGIEKTLAMTGKEEWKEHCWIAAFFSKLNEGLIQSV